MNSNSLITGSALYFQRLPKLKIYLHIYNTCKCNWRATSNNVEIHRILQAKSAINFSVINCTALIMNNVLTIKRKKSGKEMVGFKVLWQILRR